VNDVDCDNPENVYASERRGSSAFRGRIRAADTKGPKASCRKEPLLTFWHRHKQDDSILFVEPEPAAWPRGSEMTFDAYAPADDMKPAQLSACARNRRCLFHALLGEKLGDERFFELGRGRWSLRRRDVRERR
jgi:hypothetical protein